MMAAPQPVLEVGLEPKTEPAALPATVSSSDQALMMIERFAADPSFDVTKLQALMDMRKDELRRVAEQEFNVAMSKAQGKMRVVAPDLFNKQTSSHYASYAALDRMARPVYTEFGFGLSFDSQESKLTDHVLVLCYVSHEGGFSRTYRVDLPADGKGIRDNAAMTKTHAAGSAFSYAQRYLLRLIFNLAVGEDDDGNAAGDTSERSSEPDGFAAWIDEMQQTSLLGTKALTDKWKASDNIFKNFILVKDWEAMKHAAKLADKAAERA
jgi:hypothetical protein